MAETGTVNSMVNKSSAVSGQRVKELDVTFSGAGTLTITKAALGLVQVNELVIVAKASGGAAVNLTTNTDGAIDTPATGTTVLTAGAAVSNVKLRFYGH